MKITLEFNNAEKFFTELPKFASLIEYASQYASFDHVDKDKVVEAILQSTNPPINKAAVPAEKPLPETEAAIREAVAEATQEEAPEAPTEKPEPKAKKSTPKEKKPQEPAQEKPEEAPKAEADAPKDVDVRKVLNKLIKAGKRDDVAAILKSFDAANFTGLDPVHYAAVIEKAEHILQEG